MANAGTKLIAAGTLCGASDSRQNCLMVCCNSRRLFALGSRRVLEKHIGYHGAPVIGFFFVLTSDSRT